MAAQYEQEAKYARDKAQLHRDMLERNYKGAPYSKVPRVNVMKGHCQDLIKSYDSAATDAEALAKEHRAAAGGK